MIISPRPKSFTSCFVFFTVFLGSLDLVVPLYSSQSNVVDLTTQNFDRLVLQDDNIWIVEFFAPWCGHCRQLVPEYEKAAKGLKGIVKVGAIDCDTHKELAGQYGVQGFPTIKIFATNKKLPQDYNGGRTAGGLVEAALKALKDKAYDQLGDGRKSGSSKSDGSDVIELTDSNFDDKVLKSDDLWLVEFFAPWCGHCKNLAPVWAEAATRLKGKVKLGALDATVHTTQANKYGIRGYPSIKLFPSGAKNPNSAEEYSGGRTADDIVNWALDKLSDSIPPPEVYQLTDRVILKEACEDRPLCVISVLPHILDCQSKCRNDHLRTLRKLGEKYKKQMWGWIWSEGGSQMELETALGIGGFGYPALAVVNAKKMKFSLLRGAFSYDGINEFLRDLSFGQRTVTSLPIPGASLPSIVKAEKWDGKDGVLPQEDEIDLSDVELEKDEL